jgi:hypothetical protein
MKNLKERLQAMEQLLEKKTIEYVELDSARSRALNEIANLTGKRDLLRELILTEEKEEKDDIINT